MTGTEVCSESPERQARDPPKSLSNLTTTMFDLSQCKHCVCMRWREKEKMHRLDALHQQRKPSFFTPQIAELTFTHHPTHKSVCSQTLDVE